MLSPHSVLLLVLQQLQVFAQTLAGHRGIQNLVHKASLGGDHGVGEAIRVLGGLFLHIFALENDLHCSLGAHDGHLGTGPGVVVVTCVCVCVRGEKWLSV
jgi:hypothetical protein